MQFILLRQCLGLKYKHLKLSSHIECSKKDLLTQINCIWNIQNTTVRVVCASNWLRAIDAKFSVSQLESLVEQVTLGSSILNSL